MSVYFAESCGYMKIGYSATPIARSTTITRTGTRPDDVPYAAETHLIGWVPGGMWDEYAIQARFIESRVVGEWFRIDRELIHELIWADPCGVDVQRMTAAAVFTFTNSPEGVTRAHVEAAGVPIMAASSEAALFRAIDRLALDGGAA